MKILNSRKRRNQNSENIKEFRKFKLQTYGKIAKVSLKLFKFKDVGPRILHPLFEDLKPTCYELINVFAINNIATHLQAITVKCKIYDDVIQERLVKRQIYDWNILL